MKLFLGTDICGIDRIQSLYDKFGEKFLNRTFTQEEIKYCLSKPRHIASRLAVRFATKEAVSKALGVGVNKLGWDKGINWKDVELLRFPNGNVGIKLCGKAKVFQDKLNINSWEVSVAHDNHNATSTVIAYNSESKE